MSRRFGRARPGPRFTVVWNMTTGEVGWFEESKLGAEAARLAYEWERAGNRVQVVVNAPRKEEAA